ncbi:MAG: cytochrome c family protein [Litorimonas sp.]
MRQFPILLAALCLAACSAEPAQVENSGQKDVAASDKTVAVLEPTATPKSATEDISLTSDATALSGDALLAKGRRVFLKCRSCHTLDQDGVHKVGPALWGFYGEPAGSRAGFTYSEALNASGIIWTDETLSAYLEAPARYMPGTKMAYVGLRDAGDRAAVIAYLKRETAADGE